MLQYGRVSPAEMVQAVQELLSAAGIHMDVEKQSLLQNTLSLQEQLKESQAALLVEQVYFLFCSLVHWKCSINNTLVKVFPP